VATFFLGTAYHAAIIDRGDRLHARAVELARELDAAGARFVTTDDVLSEFLTFMSGQGESVRAGAIAYVDALRGKRSVIIVRQSPQLFDAALGLYRSRTDKS
jgi:predicted nucleic acid-binding protein